MLIHRKTMLGKILGISSLLTVGFSGILGENPAVGILETKHCNRTSKMRPIHYRVASNYHPWPEVGCSFYRANPNPYTYSQTGNLTESSQLNS